MATYLGGREPENRSSNSPEQINNQLPVAISSRRDILRILNGSSFKLPNFCELLSSWTVTVSSNLEKLEDTLAARSASLLAEIQSSASTFHYQDVEKQKRKIHAMGVPYFVATWWPEATLETQLVMAQMVLWLFLWDDEVDSNDSSASLSNDLVEAEVYRKETKTYLWRALGLNAEQGHQNAGPASRSEETTRNKIITSFSSVAQAVCMYPRHQRMRLYIELEVFVDATGREQLARQRAHLPSLEKYLEVRMATNGARPLCILFGMLNGTVLDMNNLAVSEEEIVAANSQRFQQITTSSDERTFRSIQKGVTREIEVLIVQTNLNIAITNDILSFPKECATGDIDSILPILLLERGSMQAAVDSAMGLLCKARYGFENAEKEIELLLQGLNDKDADSVEYCDTVRRYVSSLKSMATGHVDWSLKIGRYRLQKLDASRTITLRVATH